MANKEKREGATRCNEKRGKGEMKKRIEEIVPEEEMGGSTGKEETRQGKEANEREGHEESIEETNGRRGEGRKGKEERRQGKARKQMRTEGKNEEEERRRVGKERKR